MIVSSRMPLAVPPLLINESHPRLEDLVAQDDIVSILTNLIDSDNLPHLLLYGPVSHEVTL